MPTFAAPAAQTSLRQAVLALSLAVSLPAIAQTSATAPRVVSEMKGILVKATTALPKAGGSASDREDCPQRVIQPKSAAAKQVAAQGWAVMADVPLGPYRAVSFAGQMQAGTSGTCAATQGNIAVFSNDKLIALAYGKSADDTAIGNLVPLEGGTVRLWDGDIVPAPAGDLHVDADGTVRLTKMADEDTVCQGRAKLPNVYGMSIDKARKALAAKGWNPVRAKASGYPRQAAQFKHGIIETDDCSGTGMAYCSYSYAGPAGKLSLETAGEDDLPSVSGYSVKCR